MSTKRYQILGDIVTGAQLDEKLKNYMTTEDGAEIVEWVEVDKDNNLVISMKDGRESKYKLSGTKDFEHVEYEQSTGYLHFYDKNGIDVYDPVFIGGGQGTGTGTEVRLTNQNGTTALVGSYGSAITLMFTFTSLDNDLETGNGTCKILVNGVTKYTTSIPQGLNAIDISPYVSVGSNTVKVTCTDAYGIPKSLVYDVTVVRLTIESSFNAAVPYNGDITFKYTPYGAVEKTVHFLIDGNNAGTVNTSLTGKQLTKTISKMSHGVHRLEVYSVATVNETEIKSPSLIYDIICIEDGDQTPIIASVYEVESVEQGSMVSIPYIVYDPRKLACDVTLTIYTMESGSEVVYNTQTITVDRSQQTWNMRKYPVGTVYFRVAYGDINKTHTVTVTESSIKVEPEANDLELQLSSEGRSNNESNPGQWTYGNVSTEFTAMNWSSTGWVNDENGDACLRLNGDARAEISFQPFASDLRTYGKTIELEFAIRDVHNRNAVPISCMSGGIGFEVKPDTTYLKSEQSEVFCNYKDDERVKVTFVIESKDEYRLLSIYLNGVRSDAVQYPTTDNFQQTVPVNISIGSSDCGIDIYNIRSYSTALTSEGVKNNFIADITDIVRKTEAYEDNDVYDDFGEVSYSKAREKNSVMVIVGDLPASKGDKKKVRIEYYDVEDGNLSFSEDEVTIDIQGTSSQFYARKNWKLKFAENHYIDFDQLPAKVICIKVDYAEATGTHNTQNANFVERLYSEKTPAQLVDPKCRTTIYGKPILLFHQEDPTSDPVFYGRGNYNYDKGAEYVFGFSDQFDVECWEFKNNTSDACNFLGPVPEIWVDDFEARYPEESTAIERFKEMHDWVVSTKDNLNKFKMEFEDHFDMHYMLIYYVYTFFALMVDQRAKNMFLTYWGETGKWSPWFYDNDTSFAINNEGQLVFDYFHEDADQLEGANVYNGQNSVLWCNFRDAFPDEIKATYQDLRSNGVLNYDELVEQFITKGSDKWSESIYNEDADFKYISMLYEDGDASNLSQVRGTGEEHFRYFVENRLNYCDGKWYAPAYADDYVALRIYTPETWAGVEPNADITVTPFSHMYAGVRYKANGTLYQKRVSANEITTFEAPDETFNDTETAIYGASQLSSLGDLSPLYCGTINVSKATKLTELIIGSDVEGYSNPNLLDLSVGTNNLLKVLNVRNCPNLTDPLALSGCPNIEEIYAAGSGVTGVELANSGYLKTIELPATITNLTLKNQLYIESLTLEGYGVIKTINIENCPTIDGLDILSKATNVERVRLTNVNWSYDTAAGVLALADRNLAGIDENGANIDYMWIDGKCHIKTLTGADYLKVKEAFPYMTITYDNLTAVLTYMSEDGSTKLHEETIVNGGNGTYAETNFTKESTAQYDFTFGGWSLSSNGEPNPDALKNVEADRTVYVAFTKSLRKYTVKFYNGTTLLETKTVEYGSDATYTGATPVHPTAPDDCEFRAWKPEPTNIQGDTNCYAQWYDKREITDSWETIAAAVADGTATDKYAIGAFKMLDIGATPLPYDFECGSAVMYNNELHILGSVTSDYQKAHYKWTGSEWVEVSTLPYSFTQGAAVVFNNEIHIIGSNASSLYRTNHYKWDGATWTEVSELPYSFANGSAIVCNNEIHILGSSKSYTTHYKWDGTTWTEVSTIPYDYYAGSVVVYNGALHLLGGSDSGKKHYKYDGAAWTSVSTIPYSFSYGSAFIYNNEIHLLGGTDSKTNHYKWDGSAWAEVEELPYSFDFGSSVITDTEIYLMGGSTDATAFYHYSFEGSKWSKVGVTESIPMEVIAHNHDELASGYKWETAGELPHMFYRGSCVVLNNEIHIMGSDYGTHSKKHYKWDGTSWTSVSTIPYEFDYGSAVVYNDEIHILGGSGADTKHYKWTGTEWVSVSTLPYNFYRGIAVVFNNEIHIMGSANTQYRLVHYKWDGTEWTSVGAPPYGVQDTAAVVFNNAIHILGSYMNGSRAAHYKYDGSAWTQVSTIPYDFYSGSAVVLNNEIHILGTNSTVEGRTNHYKWDGINWTEVTTLPHGFYDGCVVVYNNEITIVGSYVSGFNRSFKQLATASWDVVDEWSDFSLTDHQVFAIDNALHAISNASYYVYNGSSWTNKNLVNAGTGHLRIIRYNNEFYGKKNGGGDTILYKYDGTTWVDSGIALPYDSNNGSFLVCNDEIHLISSYYSNQHTHYKYDGSEWTKMGNLPSNGYPYNSVFVHNDELYCVYKDRNALYKFDGETWISVSTTPFMAGTDIGAKVNATYDGELHTVRNGVHYKFDGTTWTELKQVSIETKLVVFRDGLYSVGAKKLYKYSNPKATLTFFAKEAMAEPQPMHSAQKCDHGWVGSDMREMLHTTLYDSLSEDVRECIKVVKKLYDDMVQVSNVTTRNMASSDDKIWLASMDEVWIDEKDHLDGQGECYPVFTNGASKIRYNANGKAVPYWLRSMRGPIQFYYVAKEGWGGHTVSNLTDNYVIFGFCI